MNTTTRFIDTLLTNQSDKSEIATLVQQQSHADPRNRIALTFVQLFNERKAAKARAKISGNALDGEVSVKPEQMMSFVQKLQNQSCWAVRASRIAIQKQAESEELHGLSTGLDFGQDTANQHGLEGSTEVDHSMHCHGLESFDALVDALEDSTESLNRVYDFLATKMSYIVFDDFDMFVQKSEVDGEWIETHRASDWDSCISILEQIVEELPEQQSAEMTAAAQDIDFETGEIAFKREGPTAQATDKPNREESETELAVGEFEQYQIDDPDAADEFLKAKDLEAAQNLVASVPNITVNPDV